MRVNTTVKRCLSAAALASALALGGCGGGGGNSEEVSLSDRIFGSSESFRSDELKVQAGVKQCMEAQGWKYTPIDPAAGSVLNIDFGSESFVKENGYGVTTLYGKGFGGFTAAADPNAAYLESLKPADREAYQEALYGELPEPAPTGGVAVSGFAGFAASGCLGEANKAIRGDLAEPDPKLFDKLQELETRIHADPRLVKATGAWSACMAKQGFTYRDEDAVRKDLQARLQKITGDSGIVIGGSGAIVSIPGSTGGDTPKPDYDEAALSALQDEERRIASAGFTCRKEHLNGVEKTVRKDLEAAFVDDNASLLEGLK
ncbi:MAG: hypothetical protein ACKVT1_12420 [Dehalococcoidia bacterium]